MNGDGSPESIVNVGVRLTEMAKSRSDSMAVAAPTGRGRDQKLQYETLTFQELDEQSSQVAAGLRAMGLQRGARVALLTPPGLEFITCVFAMFKAGLVIVLIDPGMGKRNLIGCPCCGWL